MFVVVELQEVFRIYFTGPFTWHQTES